MSPPQEPARLDRCPQGTLRGLNARPAGASQLQVLPLIKRHLLTGLQPVELALQLPAWTLRHFLSSSEEHPNLLRTAQGPSKQTQPCPSPSHYFSWVPTHLAPWTPGHIVQAVPLPLPFAGLTSFNLQISVWASLNTFAVLRAQSTPPLSERSPRFLLPPVPCPLPLWPGSCWKAGQFCLRHIWFPGTQRCVCHLVDEWMVLE